jgi:hypothetical protein
MLSIGEMWRCHKMLMKLYIDKILFVCTHWSLARRETQHRERKKVKFNIGGTIEWNNRKYTFDTGTNLVASKYFRKVAATKFKIEIKISTRITLLSSRKHVHSFDRTQL